MKDSLIPEEKVTHTRGAAVFRRLRTIAVSILVIAFCVWLVLEWERTRVSVMGGSADPWYHRIMALFRPASPYPVIDSGFEAGNIFWIDDERAIFSGASSESMERAKQRANGWPAPRTFIWNTGTGEVKDYSEGGVTCFGEGNIRIGIQRGKQWFERIGKFGEEAERRQATAVEVREAAEREGRQAPRPPDLNRFNCTYYESTQRLPSVSGWEFPLRSGHGTLLFGPSSHANLGPLIYFPAERHDPNYLPVQNWQVEPSSVTYSEFRRAYVLYSGIVEPGRGSNWPIDTPRPVRLLHPGGAVDVIEIPYGPWISEGGSRIQLSAKGLVWGQSYESSPRRKAERGGAYLFDGTKVIKLLRGEPTALVVSPNGCKLAMSVNSDYPVWRNRLVMISVCNGGQTK